LVSPGTYEIMHSPLPLPMDIDEMPKKETKGEG